MGIGMGIGMGTEMGMGIGIAAAKVMTAPVMLPRLLRALQPSQSLLERRSVATAAEHSECAWPAVPTPQPLALLPIRWSVAFQ